MTELIPYIQLGFAAIMALALFGLVRNNNEALLKQSGDMMAKVSMTLENHLSSVARSLTLVEERLSKADNRSEIVLPMFYKMMADTDLIKAALVQSTIVPPGTKATIEPSVTPDAKAATKVTTT